MYKKNILFLWSLLISFQLFALNNSLFQTKSNPSLSNEVVDIHFSVLKGHGWLGGGSPSDESGEEHIYNVTSSVTTSDNQINFSLPTLNTPSLKPNQLIVYLGDDNEYYTNVIASISGATITMKENFESSISLGQNLFNFYNNESHPNKYGYISIADYLIRSDRYTGLIEVETNEPVAFGSAAFSNNNTNSVAICGSTHIDSIDISTGFLGGHVEYILCNFSQGDRFVELIANTFGGNIQVSLSNNDTTFSEQQIISNTPTRFLLPADIFDPIDGDIKVRISSAFPIQNMNMIKTVRLIKKVANSSVLQNSEVAMLGDSWFAQGDNPGNSPNDEGYVRDRLQERIPSSNFINLGFGGDTSLDLLNRFDNDVTSLAPDVVLMIAGTNDYYGNVSQNIFSHRIDLLRQKCENIGANSLFLNSSIGSFSEDPTRYDLSRQYAVNVDYYKTSEINGEEKFILPAILIAPYTTKRVLFLGRYAENLTVTEYYLSHSATINSSTSINGGLTPLGSLVGDQYKVGEFPFSISNPRFITLTIHNGGSTPIELNGYIKVLKN